MPAEAGTEWRNYCQFSGVFPTREPFFITLLIILSYRSKYNIDAIKKFLEYTGIYNPLPLTVTAGFKSCCMLAWITPQTARAS
jgi:hypothetical protein